MLKMFCPCPHAESDYCGPREGHPYEIVPVVPLAPPPSWHDLSPLGYIPAVEDDGYNSPTLLLSACTWNASIRIRLCIRRMPANTAPRCGLRNSWMGGCSSTCSGAY